MPGSELGTAPAGTCGTLSPPLCCLLCWSYTERFQEVNLLCDVSEATADELWVVSFTQSWHALHMAPWPEVTPPDEVGARPGAGA